MFTGLILDIGRVLATDRPQGKDLLLRIGTRLDLSNTPIGASIACSGVCLTVIRKGPDWFEVEASDETLSKTLVGHWQVGRPINLEFSLKLGDELGGHLVYGHVDGLATVVSITPEAGSHRVHISLPSDYARYVAPKGSIALDGVSLTVNAVEKDGFDINIIPHTWEATTFASYKPGDKIHFEVDMLARYVARMLGR